MCIRDRVYTLKLPLYLDSIGTIFVAAVAGPLAGLVTGALTLSLIHISEPTRPY